MNHSPKHQPRWRITEEMSAELGHARREGGFKSWEDFFANLLQCRLKTQAAGRSPEPIPEELKSIGQRMESFEANQKLYLALAESNEEALQAIQQGQEETMESVRRVINLLNHAVKEEAKRPSSSSEGISRRLSV